MRSGKKSEAIKPISQSAIGSAIEVIDRLSEKDIHGHGEEAQNLTLSIGGDNSRVLKTIPVAMIVRAQAADIKPICEKLLKRMKILAPDETLNRRMFFDDSATDELKPEEIKYAVLNLLGVKNLTARAVSNIRLSSPPGFSESFKKRIKDFTRRCISYPLLHPSEFHEFTNLNTWNTWHSDLPLTSVFSNAKKIPTLYPINDDDHSVLRLETALSFLHKVLDGKSDVDVEKLSGIERKLLTRAYSPFSTRVFGMLEEKGLVKGATKTVDSKNLG